MTGNYTQNAGGTLEIEIASNGGGTPTPGVDHDQFAVTGNATVTGTLSLLAVGGYTVANNDTFRVMTVSGVPTGAFSPINPIGGETVTPNFIPNALDIVLTLSGAFTFTGAVDNDWNTVGNNCKTENSA